MKRKKLVWISSSFKDLRSFPDRVKRTMGYGLHLAQVDKKAEIPSHSKALGEQV